MEELKRINGSFATNPTHLLFDYKPEKYIISSGDTVELRDIECKL